MAWIFSLSAECGATQEAADSFANHFKESSWVSSGEEMWKCRTQVFQDVCCKEFPITRRLLSSSNPSEQLVPELAT
jgi:hypothetical protein